MMTKKWMVLGTAITMALFPLKGQAVLSFCKGGPTVMAGIVAMDPKHAEIKAPEPPPCAAAMDMWISTWIDAPMTVATGLDYLATREHNERTIDAEDAINQLEEALESDDSGSSTSAEETSGDSSDATVYAAEMVLAEIEVTNKSGEDVFNNTRQAIKDYLFETPSPDIKGDCTQSDKDCATARQNEWLLASVALASATADKMLDQTAKQNVKDGKTEAEKTTETKKDTSGDTEGTGGGSTTLTSHFEELAANFNKESSPTGLYNRMADIVLDTHRHINDANALMGRDLEAQGLRAVNESGPVLLSDDSETEE